VKYETAFNCHSRSRKKFYLDFNQKGKVVMLNLLRFKLKADYSSLDSIAPENQMSGREAYDLYMEAKFFFMETVKISLLVLNRKSGMLSC
jgi:hypothetical protein